MLHIFHHNDADGYAAAFLVKDFYIKEKNFSEEDIVFYEMTYDKVFPLNKINKNDLVYIVDFSIEPYDMCRLLQQTKMVTWIDHHISSIEKYFFWKDLILEINDVDVAGIRLNGISGCGLTWLYLYNNIRFCNIEDKNDPVKLYTEVINTNAPKYIKLINDWDVWNLKFDETKRFILALSNNLTMDTFKQLDSNIENNILDNLIALGGEYEKYRDNWAAQLRKQYGYEVNMFVNSRPVSIYCLNVGNANSDYSGIENLNKYDIICHYCFNGKFYKYSLYSNKDYIDCVALAKFFGGDNGGGHKGAAGFIHKELLFKI